MSEKQKIEDETRKENIKVMSDTELFEWLERHLSHLRGEVNHKADILNLYLKEARKRFGVKKSKGIRREAFKDGKWVEIE